MVSDKKSVGLLLGLGILFIPLIFSWVTLRKGHSTISKAIALSWLGFIIITYIVMNHELLLYFGHESIMRLLY